MRSTALLLASSLASHSSSFRSLFSIRVVYIALVMGLVSCTQSEKPLQLFPANHASIEYMGRVDYSDSTAPKFWQPGVQFTFTFTGDSCGIVLQDELLWGTSYNYIQLVVDSVEKRLKLGKVLDTLWVTGNKEQKQHQVTVIKNTEAGMGFIAVKGVIARELRPVKESLKRKIEFIGNSITCGMGNDTTGIPCGKGQWFDQHNASKAYGALTANVLQAKYHLSSVSGIGLMHSCCGLKITMPQVFDKINLTGDSLQWNFNNYQPDLVSVCLGQNDGVQDSTVFVNNYVKFLKQLRVYYPKAQFICITSPMADDTLRTFLKGALNGVLQQLHKDGDTLVDSFVFEQSYTSGCDYHPSGSEHQQIAQQLTTFIRQKMKW